MRRLLSLLAIACLCQGCFVLDEINAEVPAYERISNIFVCDEWTIGNALLTPTMKLKRKQIENHYRSLVEQQIDSGRVKFLD